MQLILILMAATAVLVVVSARSIPPSDFEEMIEDI
jgi:hypothetical protein